MKVLLLNIILFFLLTKSISQAHFAPISFTNYTLAEGLPSLQINNIAQDNVGFIWITTGQGLVRFDGIHFKTFRHSRSDSNSMPFSNVNNCVTISNQRLIFVSNLKMWMLDTKNNRQYAPPLFWKNKEEALPYSINRNLISIRCKNTTYFVDSNLNILDSLITPISTNYAKQFIDIGDKKIIFADLYRTFCYSIKDKKIEEWNISTDIFFPEKICNIWAVDTLKQIVYCGSYLNGVFTFSYNQQSPMYLKPKRFNYPFLGAIRNIIYNKGNIIVSTDHGINIIRGNKTELFAKHIENENNSILPDYQDQIFADRENNYWIIGGNGISRFSLDKINYQFWKLPFPSLIHHFNRLDGTLFMNSVGYGSQSLDIKSGKFTIIDSTIIPYCWGAVPVNGQVYLYGNSDRGKYILPAYNVKLLSFDPIRNKISKPDFLQPFYNNTELITLVYQANNGDVWFSLNYGNGLLRQDAKSRKITQYKNTDKPTRFALSYATHVSEDRQGNIYFSSNRSSKILVWSTEGKIFKEWSLKDMLLTTDNHGNAIYDHIVDHNNNLWISYQQKGLLKYNLQTHKARLYDCEDGLPDNTISGLMEDADGNIWFPSAKGLCCLVSATDKFLIFTQKDGLPLTDFSNSSLYFGYEDSTLYFSNTGYLYKFPYKELYTRKKNSTAYLTIDEMLVNGRPYYFEQNNIIRLKPDENSIQLTCTVLNIDQLFSFSHIEYLLTFENSKPVWQELIGSQTISFNNLKSGSYSLQIRVSNEANGTYVYGNRWFEFTIETIWYKTLWFIGLVILLSIGLVVYVFRNYYMRKLDQHKAVLEKERALAAERSRIAADMHDDVGAGLSRIRYITTAVKEGRSLTDADMDKILLLSDESVEKMNEIIWSLNQDDSTLEDLIYYIRSQIAMMISKVNIKFTYQIPDNVPPKNLHGLLCRNIFLLVKEAVNNAIKHAEPSAIDLCFSVGKKLTISVADNGKGFDIDNARKEGNGLKNYAKRAAVINGTYSIQSATNGGTIITFEISL